MSDAANEDVKFSLKVMVNKDKTKVLFAEADPHFVDILLSFLTLPLGRIIEFFDNHYKGEETPSIGSLTNFSRSLDNLADAHFVTEDAQQALLYVNSSFEDAYKCLKLDISNSQSAKYFCCFLTSHGSIPCVSIYYDNLTCKVCGNTMRKEAAERPSIAASSDGVFVKSKASFTISGDLQIFPNEIGLLSFITLLGITDAHEAQEIQVSFGFNEIMDLLKASLTSPTPLSDLILRKKTKSSTAAISMHEIVNEINPRCRNLSLKLMIRKSTGELLYAQAQEDFVEFLSGLLTIPLGGLEHLQAGKSCFKAINNLYRSTAELDDKYFKTSETKKRLMNPHLPHGCISPNQILPLTEECLPAEYIDDLSLFSSVAFPEGQGRYLERPTTYLVSDNLTVTPYFTASALCRMNKEKIPISDVEEMQLQIGLKEALSILKASLTSTTTALSDALLNAYPSHKRQKK
ncbi:uncharacterized protein LOC131010012 [Salvia miltiorrhiza]|uniref:uncharacterized protein LOC131010007 n=1 Tax=Salvia miltiorrhiza TaxID=226208 RepID=UPI0025AC2660|nr:uncharacterized protein LOC131010007 [Salvia miltiorrhiza]XP_057793389.1 uncharacterized protein LOC131010012 [Salvia miltiorrhiza]